MPIDSVVMASNSPSPNDKKENENYDKTACADQIARPTGDQTSSQMHNVITNHGYEEQDSCPFATTNITKTTKHNTCMALQPITTIQDNNIITPNNVLRYQVLALRGGSLKVLLLRLR